MPRILTIDRPSEKQKLVLTESAHKFIAYGGARGGGKSWVVRTKAKLLAVRYPGIKMLILRRTYPELQGNHIDILTAELYGIARYNKQDKKMTFPSIGGKASTIKFDYCSNDSDLMHFQGQEYDIIFIDEATNFTDHQLDEISACLRGANNFPKRIYYTCNPGGPGHQYIKRLFIDRSYLPSENGDNYIFFQALPTENTALMQAQPDYISQLERLPKKLRDAWLYGRWDVFEGQYFEDFTIRPSADAVERTGLSEETLRQRHLWTHVIPPLEEIPREWKIYRGFDWGYAKPFATVYMACDWDGRLIQFAEFYGCTGDPNEGVKWDADKVFAEMREYENTHPLLRDRQIQGIADPSIWDKSRGTPIADMGIPHGIVFTPGDNKRIPGWMQMHYRMAFDGNGRAMWYVAENCKHTIRTLPLLMYDDKKIEDLDTEGEDHLADAIRYVCMARPIKAPRATPPKEYKIDPLTQTRRAI